jgi:hypothetical protein
MCDYSLSACKTRDAQVADELISGAIVNEYGNRTTTKGFYTKGVEDVAVCLRPGTELAFEMDVAFLDKHHYSVKERKVASRVACFREVNESVKYKHHDALEFSDGTVVFLNDLVEGQRCRVLQLPATVKQFHAEGSHPADASVELPTDLEPVDIYF